MVSVIAFAYISLPPASAQDVTNASILEVSSNDAADAQYKNGGYSYTDSTSRTYDDSRRMNGNNYENTPSIPLYKAGGLRNSRFDRAGFTLFELNQINEINLKNTYTHGNGVPYDQRMGNSNDQQPNSHPTNGGLGVIGAPTTVSSLTYAF
jgi:hypothetical protein